MNGKVRINLLPPELQGKAGRGRGGRRGVAEGTIRQGPHPIFVLIAVAAFSAGGFGLYQLWLQTDLAKRENQKTKTELAELKVEVMALREEFKEFVETRDLILSLSEVLASIDPPNRIVWAEKLLMLTDLVPQNVYITGIKVIEKERMVLTEESSRAIRAWEKAGRKGPKPVEIKKPLIHQEMTISALANADEEEEQLEPILSLLESMMDYERPRKDGSVRRFMENFVDEEGGPRYNQIKATTYEAEPVYEFEIWLKTIPLSAQVGNNQPQQGN